MIERAVVVIPKFENINVINDIRDKYDPLAKLISPHITLVFPFKSELTKDEINLKLQSAFANQYSFNIELSGITKQIDSFGNYLFLNLTEGDNEIKKLYKILYKVIFSEDKNPETYIPHITIGKFNSLDMLEGAYKEVVLTTDIFKTVVNTVSVEIIEKKDDSIFKIEHEINYYLK